VVLIEFDVDGDLENGMLSISSDFDEGEFPTCII
jgi:hypothetical protein